MKKKVYIGVGHGGTDPGACGGGARESDLNLVIALQLESELRSCGIETMISRANDKSMRTGEKVKQVLAYKPDLSVELHHNAGGGKGFEIYCSTRQNGTRKLAECIEREIVATGRLSRGVKQEVYRDGKLQRSDNIFGMVGSVPCGVLVEFGFVDNPMDLQLCRTSARLWALATAKGILAYLGHSGATKPNQAPIVGSVVRFTGGPVYRSATALAATSSRPASICKITAIARGYKHPYHCVSQDGKGVYGWVDSSTIAGIMKKGGQ